MPSHTYGSTYASAPSSSRHPEHRSSNSRSSGSERHRDDANRRPRSPEPSRYSYREHPDVFRPSKHRYEDDHPSSYYPPHNSRHADEPDYYKASSSRSRGPRYGYSPPPYDRRESVHGRRHDDDYGRHASSSYRRPRSPDPRSDRTTDGRDSWDGLASRDDRRRLIDHRDARRSGTADDKQAHSARRHSRSPERHRSSRPDRDSERHRPNGEYESSRYRDDRDARRHGRDRSRSRSRERVPGTEAKNESRSSKVDRQRAASEDGQLIEDTEVARDEAKLLNRRAHPKTIAASSTQSLRPREQHRLGVPNGTESWDGDDDDRLEKLAAASKPSSQVNGTQARPSESARSRDANGTAAQMPVRHVNGYKDQPPRCEHRPHNEPKPRKRSRSPSSSRTSTLGSSSTSATSAPSSQTAKQVSATPARQAAAKTMEKKLSFGHVQLPHELPAEARGKNWMAATPYKEGVKSVRETAAEKHVIDVKPDDPRRGRRLRSPRETLHSIRYAWDANSVGNRPLPAPRNLVLTNLSALMKPIDILPHIRTFGRIESSKIEMDPKIGQSLGIFTVCFAHDFDEHGKPLSESASVQTLQHGGRVAKAAHIALNGKQMGHTRVATFLDRSGEVVAEKVKETLAANEAKLRRPPTTAPAGQVSASPSTPSATKSNMPPPNVPRGPRASLAAASSPQATISSSSVRTGSERYEGSSARWSSSRYGFGAEEARSKERSSMSDPYGRRRDADEYALYPSRSSSSRRDEASDRRSTSSRPNLHKKRSDKVPTAEIISTLAKNKSPYIFIPKPKSCNIDTDHVSDQLADTPPRWVREGDTGWYAAYESLREAHACKIVNETLSINGYTLQVEVRSAPPQTPSAKADTKSASSSTALSTSDSTRSTTKPVQKRKTFDAGLRPLTTEEKQKTAWTATELQDAVFRMLQKELADTFIRDVKSRVVAPHLNAYLKPSSEGGQILAKAVIKKPIVPSKPIDRGYSAAGADAETRLPSFRKVASAKPKKPVTEGDAATYKAKRDSAPSSKDREQARKAKDYSSSEDETLAHAKRSDGRIKTKPVAKKRGVAAPLLDSDEEEESDGATPTEPDATSRSVSASVEPAASGQREDDPKPKKRTKAKAEPKGTKKGAAKKSTAISADLDVEMDDGDETATPGTEVLAKTSKAKSKQVKAPVKARPIPDDPFEAGVVEDEEDLYHLRMVLERIKMDHPLTESEWPDEAELEEEAEEAALAAGTPPKHSTGSARTEGMYRIAPEHKALHLPDRNKATEEADSAANAHILQSARNNRADSRRLVLGLEQHKRETATDTDIFKFNQLRTRKKQLKFAKSPIHDWGLYAMEYIPAGDMVIEYVGEVVRQQVADEREKAYERGGNFSTYLFRVDDDLVVDATHKGNIARLMNHCCTPNCNAKILTLNGEKRIVLFAKSPIRAGEELTYDYKFQSSADDEDAIPCLCGSPGCRRFL